MSRLTLQGILTRLAVSLGSLVVLVSVACVTAPPPVEEYTLARAAIDSAKAVDAARYSPGFFHKAEVSFRTGQLSYEERDFEAATQEFNFAREYAEKAENSSRLIRFKNGEVL